MGKRKETGWNSDTLFRYFTALREADEKALHVALDALKNVNEAKHNMIMVALALAATVIAVIAIVVK